MGFQYVSVEEAIPRAGLRVVVVGKVPSPWGEAAKGLFHRAIAQSGSQFRGATKANATKAAEEFLARGALKSNQLDQLQKMRNMGPMENHLTSPSA